MVSIKGTYYCSYYDINNAKKCHLFEPLNLFVGQLRSFLLLMLNGYFRFRERAHWSSNSLIWNYFCKSKPLPVSYGVILLDNLASLQNCFVILLFKSIVPPFGENVPHFHLLFASKVTQWSSDRGRLRQSCPHFSVFLSFW